MSVSCLTCVLVKYVLESTQLLKAESLWVFNFIRLATLLVARWAYLASVLQIRVEELWRMIFRNACPNSPTSLMLTVHLNFHI